jgi:hypothetical protein
VCPTQVPLSLLLLVPSGQVVLDQVTQVRVAPVSFSPRSVAKARFAPVRFALVRTAAESRVFVLAQMSMSA